jgi:anti-sigma B factor antagonist
MKLDVERRGTITILHLAGELRAAEGDDWAKRATDLLGEGGARLVIDLAHVNYVSSAGLGQLVRVAAHANSQGVRLLLCNLTPFVQQVLTSTGLDKFFNVASSLDDALARLA